MKNFILVLIASTGICFIVSAQSTGDYRSVGNGNWNDATKWRIYNGSTWINTNTYPGQNPGTGAVTIMHETAIGITETVPYPVNSLFVSIDDPNILPTGLLIFSSESAVSLTVSGNVAIRGEIRIDDQNGIKTHQLFIGRNFYLESNQYDEYCNCYLYGIFQTINQDDKLGVIFNTNDANSEIYSNTVISFHDITFNGTGISVPTGILITGNATFINGIVRPDSTSTRIHFMEGATVSGGSHVSFIDGIVYKAGDTPFTFPIGTEGVYAPLTISSLLGQEEIFAYYTRNSGTTQETITDPGLYSISNCERWVLSRPFTSTNNTFDVTLGWTSADRCGSSSFIANVSEVTLAHHNGSSWDTHSGTGIGTISNGSVTWNGMTTYGVLTLGNVGTGCNTPSQPAASNITSNSATLSWTAVPGFVSYDVDYRARYSTLWNNLVTATTSTSVNLSGLTHSTYYEWKVRANCISTSSVFRQSQFTTAQPPQCTDVYESNNTPAQAKTISLGTSIFAGISPAYDVDWFKVTTPNNSIASLEVILSNLPADYDLYVYDRRLKLVGYSNSSGTSNEVVVINSPGRKTPFYIKILGKNGAFNISQCYNLLIQVNNGARSEYITSNTADKEVDIQEKPLLYPNPASEFVFLRFNSSVEGPVNVQIWNTSGQLVKQYSVNLTKGYNQARVPVTDIVPGIYLLKINKGLLNLTKKFVIAR